MTSDATIYLIRLSGTISTKSSRTRRKFKDRLEANIRDALHRREIDYEFRREWNRLFVVTEADGAGELLASVAGIQSVRPSVEYQWETLDDIIDRGYELFAERVVGHTFGVDTRRVGQREWYDFDSVDVNRQLGGVLDEEGGSVDLDNPDVPVCLEIHRDKVYFYESDIPGPGGLPVGVEGRALSLVSGGFDSAVASWLMLKRGVALDFVFFNLGGPPHERGVREVMGTLVDNRAHGYCPKMHVVDFRPLLAELKTHVSGPYWQVILKRLMARAADRIARRDGYPALVTGEAIGQVSSQTLSNLAAIETPIETPILRPLVGYNKEHIVDIARDIGIRDVAAQVPEFCALEGGRPVTQGSSGRLDAEEEALDLDLIGVVCEDRRTADLRTWAAAKDDELDVQVDAVPDDIAVVDLRSQAAYDNWHYPDALHVPFETAIEQYALLPRETGYLLYCDVGLKSALIAEKMQQAGFDAHSFRGGVPKLKRWAVEHA